MLFDFGLFKLSGVFLLVIIFPLVQNQWLNLYLFDSNNLSFYRFLYNFSGILFSLIVSTYSYKNFSNYNFLNPNLRCRKLISGKILFVTVTILLITLSLLISNYLFLNIELVTGLFFNINHNFNLALDNQLFMILVFSVLFIFKKTRQYMKGFIILNFFISSSIFWYTKVNNLQIIDKTLFKNFIELENINYSNILLFGSLEIIFYLWSYVSYKTNLSDWIVYKPIKKDILFIMKILFFYLLIAVYYTLLE